jgi:hypothetical protein
MADDDLVYGTMTGDRLAQLIDAIVLCMRRKGGIALTEQELEAVMLEEDANALEIVIACQLMAERARARLAN